MEKKSPAEQFITFLERLPKQQRVIIQPHDFPDHDAISSAFALQYLLKTLGYDAKITFNGYIDRISLRNMMDWLEIDAQHITHLPLTPNDKIIVIDGCIGEKNVTDMPGLEVAVIDHHQVSAPDHVWFADVRPHVGATATIMVEYFQALNIEMTGNIATALLVGMMFDTNQFSRGMVLEDMRAMLALRNKADLALANKIYRNQLEYRDLKDFNTLIDSLNKTRNIASCFLPDCPKNMLGVLGDFLLTIDEIDITLLACEENGRIYLSMRSECANTNVGQVLKQFLNQQQIGFGGGHRYMAGGVINDPSAMRNIDHLLEQLTDQL